MTIQRPRVLAIDDTPANLMVLATALSDEFEFQLAASGPAGYELALATPPDLVLLDIMMPEVDGLETCRRFKSDPRLRHIPIIFLTALSDIGTEVHGLKLGADDFLHKPLNLEIGRQRMRNLLDRERLRRALDRHRLDLERLVDERTESLRRSNDELRHARDAAEVASRVKAEFLANVSHELRTPLNIILALTDLLNRRLQEPDLQDKSLKVAQAGRQLLHMIDDVLLLARMEDSSGEPPWEATRTQELLDHILAQFQDAAVSKGLRLTSKVGRDVPAQFMGQSTRLIQILRHFASNAIKFSSRGEVRLSVHRAADGDAEPRLRFTVLDQGAGMTPERIERIFEAFTQGDGSAARPHGGLGIGLTISRHLSQLMGGEISVRSRVGEGSAFSVTVPVRIEARPRTSGAPTKATPDGARPAAADSATPDSPAITDGHRMQLSRMIGLLRDGDTEAIAEWRAASDWLRPLMGAAAELLTDHLDQFAFEEALELLERTVVGSIPLEEGTR